MKILYLSSSEIGVKVFDALFSSHQIVGVITAPDKPRGRSKVLVPSPIAKAAAEKNIEVFKVDKLDADFIKELKKKEIDYFITFSFGLILKKDFFDVSKYGGINIHPSMLPDLRGPSPIQSAILQGYKKSGITVQKMALKVDSGDIVLQREFDIEDDDDALSIEEKVSVMASMMITESLSGLADERIIPQPQDSSKATYCKMFKKEDGGLNWDEKAENIINRIRASVKWPIAYSFIDNNRINIYKASINKNYTIDDFRDYENGKIIFADKSNGILVKSSDFLINLLSLQQSGKKLLNWKDFLNGYRNLSDKKFIGVSDETVC